MMHPIRVPREVLTTFFVSASIFLVVALALVEASSVSAVAVALSMTIVYFVPSLIRYIRHPHSSSEFPILNLLLAWSGVGWLLLIVLALNVEFFRLDLNAAKASRSESARMTLGAAFIALACTTIFAFILGVGWFTGDPMLANSELLRAFGALGFYFLGAGVGGLVYFWRKYKPHAY